MKKAPDGKAVDCVEVSSNAVRGLLKCYHHPASLLSVPDSSGAGNIGKEIRCVVRLAREGLVHEVRENLKQHCVDFETSFGTP
ncbi:hypothetical protein ACFL45_03330 [Candidatus Neomarinimicrobiota bacterium]